MSRLIVKNLPNNCTEKGLRSQFEKYGSLSDASLKYTKEGKFRNFAFVGFLDVLSAQKAMKQMHQAFMGTNKLTVEICRPFGDDNKPRAWSQYSKESSAYKRKHGDGGQDPTVETSAPKKKKKDEKFDEFLEARGVEVEKDEGPVVTPDESKLLEELLEGVEGDTSLSLIFSGLPSSIKGKNVKEWLNPVRIKAMKIARNDNTAMSFVTFNRPPDVRRALQRDGQFLGGFKINIKKVEENVKQPEKEDPIGRQEFKNNEEEEIREKILETGRLFLRNLPYQTTEDDLTYLFKKYGELSEVQVIITKTTGQCKGFAIVEFMFPEAAVAAYAALDGYVFKGRMMHILPGDEKREDKTEKPAEDGEDGEESKKKKMKEPKSFKAQKEEEKKSNANKTHSWNSLFLGANAIADTLAERLGVSKSDVLTSEGGESAGVRLALAETRLVQETRDFLMENGVQLDAFSRPATKRSTTVMLAKNLPAGVTEEELTRMFSKFGDCKKVLIPPEGGVSALIIMGNVVDAKKAFQALAYSRFRSSPLYLEWASYDAIKSDEAEVTEDVEEEKPKKRKNKYEKKSEEDVDMEESTSAVKEEDVKREDEQEEETKEVKTDDDVIEPETTLFVKNLSFDTTDAELDRFFRKRFPEALRYAQVSKKLNPSDPSKNLSMGFGFVQFRTQEQAKQALKDMQGELLDGHSIELKLSHRQTIDKDALKRKTVSATEQGENTKMMIRNIPFQAKIKEVESLFGTFGEIKNIRIPKKMGTKDQHRGFGFVDFISPDEARRAFESLVHSTHLYGRRLVLEWAKEDDTVEELREKQAEKFNGEKSAKKQKKKDHMEALQKQLLVADDEA